MEAVFIFDTGLACDNIGQGEFYDDANHDCATSYNLYSVPGFPTQAWKVHKPTLKQRLFMHISMDGLIFRYRGNHGIATTMFFQVCFSLRAA
jgi:hypothetical protein